MPNTVTIQAPQAFTAGATKYAPRALASGTNRVVVSIARSTFTAGDAGVAVWLVLFYSPDAGATWKPWGGGGGVGGVDPDNTAIAFSIDLPDVGNPNREMAAGMLVTGAITLGIEATVFP